MDRVAGIAFRWLRRAGASDLQGLLDRLYTMGKISHKVRAEVIGPSNFGVSITLRWEDGSLAGKVYTTKFANGWEPEKHFRSTLDRECAEAYLMVRGTYGEVALWSVPFAHLDGDLVGYRIGKALYEELLEQAGRVPAVLIPHWCVGGTTTPAARRMWNSLKRRHKSVGPVVIPRNL